MENPRDPSQSWTNVDEAPSFAQTELIGQIVGDRYQVLNYLGEGSMSCVYRAGHLLTREIVALKIMHPHLLIDGNANRRFQQEAQAASALMHPHIVRVVDGGTTAQGRPFLAMDYLQGVQLSELVHGRRHPPDLDTLLHVFKQICEGMELAHSKHILHRDLRPSQIMLVEEGEDPIFVKIMDFGVAKMIMPPPEEAPAEILGNPLYMSPELCRQRPIDHRSDIYSMGCLMYEAMCGRAPIRGASPEETIYKQINEMPPSLVVPGEDARLVRVLEQIVLKCMDKDPAKRYQSMAELRTDLENAPNKASRGSETMALASLRAGEVQRKLSHEFGGLGRIFLIASIAILATMTVAALAGVYLLGTDTPSLADRFIDYEGDAVADNPDQTAQKSADQGGKPKEEFPGENAMVPSTAISAPDKEWTTCTEAGFEAFKERDYAKAKTEFMKAMNVVYTANKNLSLDRANVEGALANLALLGYLDLQPNDKRNKNEQRADAAFGFAVDTIMTCALNPLTSKDQVLEAWATMGRANELIGKQDNAEEAYVQYAMHCNKAYNGEKTFDTEQSALNAAHCANFFSQRKPKEGMVSSAYNASRSMVLNIAKQRAEGLKNEIDTDRAQIATGQVPKDQLDLAKLEMSNQEQEMNMLAAWLNKESHAPPRGTKAWRTALDYLQAHNDKVCDEIYDYAEKTTTNPFNAAAINNNRALIELALIEKTPTYLADPKALNQKCSRILEWLNSALEKTSQVTKGSELLRAKILYNKAAVEWRMNDTITALKDRMEAKQSWERSPRS
jgi:hypothetical protein